MTNAPSNRLVRSLTGAIAAPLIAASLALFCPPCSAQESPAATSPSKAAPAAASSGFQSQGIKATITSISVSSDNFGSVTVQFIIQNTRQSGVYLALVSGGSGSAGTLMASNGGLYLMDPQRLSGLPPCFSPRGTDYVQQCLEKSDEHDMTMIEAGQSGILGIVYQHRSGPQATQSDTANFALKFIVRSAPAQGGTLSAAAAAGKAGPPNAVTISFPLIPLASP